MRSFPQEGHLNRQVMIFSGSFLLTGLSTLCQAFSSGLLLCRPDRIQHYILYAFHFYACCVVVNLAQNISDNGRFHTDIDFSFLFPGYDIADQKHCIRTKGTRCIPACQGCCLLMRKGSVFSTDDRIDISDSSGYYIVIHCLCSSGHPFANQTAIISFEGDFVFFSYMLALGKFFAIIAALDTGSSFEGMGANREAFFSMLIEPAFFILMATFSMFTGFTSFSDIFSHFFITGNHYVLIYSIIGFYLFIQIALIENSRLPVDDPKTHLELTMIHEVMILDNSGFDKALIHIGTWLKFAIYRVTDV